MGADMTLKHDGYLPRCIDSVVEAHLKAFGAVEVAGTMWSGKTWTSEAHAESKTALIDEPTILAVQADPSVALAGERPHLVDEWQEVPAVWDAARRAVDEAGGERGLFLLTGSSRPARDKVRHSGAGRIARLRMWPMSLYESGDSDGAVSLAGLFAGEFSPGPVSTGLEQLARLVCRGGWPGTIGLDDDTAAFIPGQYLDALEEGVAAGVTRNVAELRALMASLARNVGSAATLATLGEDSGLMLTTGKPNAPALEGWLSILRERFVIDELCGWNAPIKSPARLRTKPKRCFADPSLPAALLGVSPGRLMLDGQLLGQLFEELCLRDLRVYTSCLKGAGPDALRYYRDSDGLEVDAVIELRDGRWGAIEIKLGANKVPEAVRSLCRLRDKVGNNPAARSPEPSFLAVLVGNTTLRYRTPEGVYVFPITNLAP